MAVTQRPRPDAHPDENVCQVCWNKPQPGEVLLSTIVCDPGGARRICGTHLTCVLNQT